jgi:uncharacterized membrane protein YozB (DUF420 family)
VDKNQTHGVRSELAIVGIGMQILANTAGFLGTRASLMLDVVFLAMFLVLPLLGVSIYFVKRGWYPLHKKMQLVLGVTLLLAVIAFEVDMRFITDWEKLAEPSPYYQVDAWSTVWTALSIHLCFAIPAAFLWGYVIVQALRKFPDPPKPGPHSAAHNRWAWLATGSMVMTAVTGWIFYYLAFVA